MASISLCMIVKDEKEVLDRCLTGAKKLVDEIIIVDTGSKDGTEKIAEKYTDKIYDYPWKDDFAAARNFAFEKANMEYCMWLDADDVISEENAAKFLIMKDTLPEDTDMVMLPYQTAFDERGNPVFSYYRERIVKNKRGFYFQGRVHEVIPPSGKILRRNIPIEHRKKKPSAGERNLRIYRQMEEEGTYFDSRALYYYGRELCAHAQYEKSREILEKFLKRKDGWIENRIEATRQLAFCFYQMGEEEKALYSLLRAFQYDVPRGETCCDLGKHFLDREQYEQAIYWYKQAFTAKKETESGAFVQEDCYGFIPAISLCVCYDRIGKQKLAEQYNEMAGRYRPDSVYYLKNKVYFQKYRQGGSAE